MDPVKLSLSVVCLVFSALFSGLTLGLMGFDKISLEVISFQLPCVCVSVCGGGECLYALPAPPPEPLVLSLPLLLL